MHEQTFNSFTCLFINLFTKELLKLLPTKKKDKLSTKKHKSSENKNQCLEANMGIKIYVFLETLRSSPSSWS